MNRLAGPLLLLACAALPAAAQVDPPPRDTLVIVADSADPALPDTLVIPDSTVRRTPPRWAAPFAVESRGSAVPRRVRGEVVWVHPDSLRPRADTTAVDSAAPAEALAAADSVRTDTTIAVAAPPRPGRRTARDTTATRRPPADSAAPARRTAAADSTAARRAGRPRTHTVAAGETLFGIARRYNVTTAQLRVLNPDVDAQDLEVGTVLRLPATARAPGAAGAAPRPAPTRPSAPAARRTHTVVRGETLFGIARRYGVSVDAIMQANRMQADQVRVGQTLVIPPAPRPD